MIVKHGPWLLTYENGKLVKKEKRQLIEDGKEWTKTKHGWVRQHKSEEEIQR